MFLQVVKTFFFWIASKYFINFSFSKLFSDGDSHDGHDHEPPIFEDKILAKLIDPVLKDGDINNDGMIDYSEFISASIRNQKGEGPVIELSSWFWKKNKKKSSDLIPKVFLEENRTIDWT